MLLCVVIVTHHLLLLQGGKACCLASPSEDSHQNPVDLGPLSHCYTEKYNSMFIIISKETQNTSDQESTTAHHIGLFLYRNLKTYCVYTTYSHGGKKVKVSSLKSTTVLTLYKVQESEHICVLYSGQLRRNTSAQYLSAASGFLPAAPPFLLLN